MIKKINHQQRNSTKPKVCSLENIDQQEKVREKTQIINKNNKIVAIMTDCSGVTMMRIHKQR